MILWGRRKKELPFSVLLSLLEVGRGGDVNQSVAMLERIMPKTREEAQEMATALRRICMGMERLRNTLQ